MPLISYLFICFFVYRRWLTTPWSDCSKSCGNGKQTRSVECVMYVNPTEYVLSNQCSEGNKPVVPDTSKSCNSFVCFPKWDTKEGLNVSKLLITKSEGRSLKFFVSVFQLQEYSQDLGSYAHCSKSPPTSSPSPPFPPPFQSQTLSLKLSLSPRLLDVVQVLESNV